MARLLAFVEWVLNRCRRLDEDGELEAFEQ
jgi:hypothetical protein